LDFWVGWVHETTNQVEVALRTYTYAFDIKDKQVEVALHSYIYAFDIKEQKCDLIL